MQFEFATATQVIFGCGMLTRVGEIAAQYGKRPLVVTGRNAQRAEPLLALLRRQSLAPVTFSVFGEPELETIEQGLKAAREHQADMIVSFGGGSAIDAGKALAALATNDGELSEYLEVIGAGKSLTIEGMPFIAIPTTAGTGAEVTRNAVLRSSRHRVKVSLRSRFMLPKVALVDPTLTYDLPPDLTASTGMDALTQLIEPYVCSRANPMTDALCVDGMRRAAKSLRGAYAGEREARHEIAIASLFGGMALANAGLGAVHGFAGPVGGMFPAPHGAVCAALLPSVISMNVQALRERQPKSEALKRYAEIGQLGINDPKAGPDEAAEWAASLVEDLKIPKLRQYGLTKEHIPELVEKSSQASSMKANPIPLSHDELTVILERAI